MVQRTVVMSISSRCCGPLGSPLFGFADVVPPLLVLLVLNSNPHRKMRRKMLQIRRFRVMVRKAMAIAQEREQASHEHV